MANMNKPMTWSGPGRMRSAKRPFHSGLAAGLPLLLVLAVMLTQCAGPPDDAADGEKLRGRWLRQDGDYLIDIRGIAPDGRLEAAYLNPNPIHVGQARWEQGREGLQITVELQDVNYPGSIYKLRYLPDQDMLHGTYYQATQGQTYEVAFSRLER